MLSVWVKDEWRWVGAAEVQGVKPLEAAERAELLRLRRQVAELENPNIAKATRHTARPDRPLAMINRVAGET